ncbi:MAG: hypothetical protein AB7O97_09185 [Planctomycetota bacterium]
MLRGPGWSRAWDLLHHRGRCASWSRITRSRRFIRAAQPRGACRRPGGDYPDPSRHDTRAGRRPRCKRPRCVSLSLSLSLSLAILGSDRVAAQAIQRVHPSIAPEPSPSTTTQPPFVNPHDPSTASLNPCPNLTGPTEHPSESPLFNRGNQQWDPGETPFGAADFGGIRDMVLNDPNAIPVLHSATQPGNVHKFIPASTGVPEGWVSISHNGVAMWRFRGYLRPTPVIVGKNVDDAAFEVVCVETYDPGKPTMIVVESPSTNAAHPGTDIICQGTTKDLGVRFAYPGWKFESGITDEPFYNPVPLISRSSGSGQSVPFNLVLARCIARLWERPATFQLQRNVELVRAVREMLTTTDTSWRPGATTNGSWVTPLLGSSIYAIQWGGSFGGALSGWEAILFPEEFVAGIYSGAILSFRHYIGEQEGMRHLMSLSGFGQISRDFFRKDALHYQAALAQAAEMKTPTPANWDPFYHGSVLRAWKDNYLQRPVLAIQADEDLATTGNDTLPLLSGQREFVPAGISAPNANGVPLLWTIYPKRCHGDHPNPPIVSPTSGQGRADFIDIILDFLVWLDPQGPQGSLLANRSFLPPPSASNGSMDVYDHAFMLPPPPPPASTPLVLSGFHGTGTGSLGQTVGGTALRPGKSFGSGTYLGYADSLIVGVPNEQDPATYTGFHEICVGSADGVVTRFAVDQTTGEFVPQAMSPALGYGAWALAFGEADGLPGKEVIVGTHRGLHTLYRDDLSIMGSNPGLPWDQSRPLRMATVQVQQTDRAQVVFASDIGMLAVYDLDTLASGTPALATHFEPGVTDLVVLPTSGIGSIDLAILSERGHVAKVHWDLGTNTMTLLKSSVRLNGIAVDMEFAEVDGNAGKDLVVLMREMPEFDRESIWVLDADDLSVIDTAFTNQFEGKVVPVATRSAGVAADLEVWNAGPEEVYFVVLREDRILVIPYGAAGSTPIVPIDLCAFQPMMRALDIAIADVFDDPANPTRSPLELVIATEAGYVTWISMDELLPDSAPGTQLPSHADQVALPGSPAGRLLSFNSVSARAHGSQNARPAHCNHTLAATWGMAVDTSGQVPTLELVDQSGTRSSVTGIGDATVVQEVGRVAWFQGQLEPLAGPFRDLSLIGPVAGSADPEVPVLAVPEFLDSSGSIPLYPGLATASCDVIATSPYQPVESGNQSLHNLGRGFWSKILDVVGVYDGAAVFPRCGDALTMEPQGNQYVCYWSGEEYRQVWGNRIAGFQVANGTLSNWWSTVGAIDSGAPAADVPWSQMHGHDLRSFHFQPMADRQAQALRLFRDPADDTKVRIAAFTPGARLFVLEPGVSATDIGPIPIEKDSLQNKPLDFGTGGMALAIGPARPGGRCSIYVGAMAFFADDSNFAAGSTQPDDQVSAICMVDYQGNTSFGSSGAFRHPELVLDGSSALAPKVYGVCGLAVGDILPAVPGPELVVGALDGHLLVFALDPVTGDIVSQPPLYQTRVEGAVGAYNSIVIADLVDDSGASEQPGVDGTNELYVAGSLGLRRWTLP